MTVSAKELGSKSEAFISVTTDRGEYSKDEISKLLSEAELFRETDNLAQEKIKAKENLDQYSFAVHNQVKRKDINKYIKQEEVAFIKEKVAGIRTWMDLETDSRTAGDYKDKEEELMISVEPLLSKIYILPCKN